jgi:hypothetical protein
MCDPNLIYFSDFSEYFVDLPVSVTPDYLRNCKQLSKNLVNRCKLRYVGIKSRVLYVHLWFVLSDTHAGVMASHNTQSLIFISQTEMLKEKLHCREICFIFLYKVFFF